MKRFVAFLFFYYCIIAYQGAHYEEGTFFKYLIFLTKNNTVSQLDKESLPITFNGTKFVCSFENENDLLNRYSPHKNIDYFINILTNVTLRMISEEWVYKLQVNKKIEQYLFDYPQESYNLGYYSHANFTTKKIKGFHEKEQVYFTQVYTHGDVCKTTGKERRTEVIYICHHSDGEEIRNIMETYSCNYVIYVFTPRICMGYGFKSVLGHAIFCDTNDTNIDFNEILMKLGFLGNSEYTNEPILNLNEKNKKYINQKYLNPDADEINKEEFQNMFSFNSEWKNLEKPIQKLVVEYLRRLVVNIIVSKEEMGSLKLRKLKSLKSKINKKEKNEKVTYE